MYSVPLFMSTPIVGSAADAPMLYMPPSARTRPAGAARSVPLGPCTMPSRPATASILGAALDATDVVDGVWTQPAATEANARRMAMAKVRMVISARLGRNGRKDRRQQAVAAKRRAALQRAGEADGLVEVDGRVRRAFLR